MEIEKSTLYQMYVINEMPYSAIARNLNTSIWNIWNYMRKYNIKARSTGEAARKYAINEEFFRVWTFESAWIYGWAIGDGCYLKQKMLKFDLSRKDRAVLEKFKTKMNSEHPIINYISNGFKDSDMSRIRFFSKKMVKDLSELSYQDIPKDFFSDFTRGFFEADGGSAWHKNNRPKGGNIQSYFSQNNYNILNFIWTKLKDNNIVKGGSLNLNKNMWQLSFRVADTLSLYHYLYDNCGDLYLPRKKEKFEELIRRQLA